MNLNEITMLSKFDIADYIIAKYDGQVTPMKLQKLLYYCYVWSLVADKKAFNANFEAWDYGPVEPEVYHHFKHFGRNPIPNVKEVKVEVSKEMNFILDSYANFSALELSKTTHLETPWKKNVAQGARIEDQELIDYYKNQPFSWNFPLSKEKKYYPPKTSSHFSFTFDMSKDYVPVYENIDDYLAGIAQAKQGFQMLISG